MKTEDVFAVLRWGRVAPATFLQQFHASSGLRVCRGQRPAGLKRSSKPCTVWGRIRPSSKALMEARENHKQCRIWSNSRRAVRLKRQHCLVTGAWNRAGVQVVYGVLGLEGRRPNVSGGASRWRMDLSCHVHMGTGNCNPVTGRTYTDPSYFTSDPALGWPMSPDLFNAPTGYYPARRPTANCSSLP